MAVRLRLEFLVEENYCGGTKNDDQVWKKKTGISLLKFNRPFTTLQSVYGTCSLTLRLPD